MALLDEVEELVASHRFDAALEACQVAIDTGDDPAFWKLQQALICFLDEHNIEHQYRDSISLAEEAVELAPDWADAHFWLAYIQVIVRPGWTQARPQLLRCLANDPQHPYAHLVLAMLDNVPIDEAISHLDVVLSKQPHNYRALQGLAKLHLRQGNINAARDALTTILSEDPYVATNLGVMNEYAHGVLTSAYWKDRTREDAARLLAGLPDN